MGLSFQGRFMRDLLEVFVRYILTVKLAALISFSKSLGISTSSVQAVAWVIIVLSSLHASDLEPGTRLSISSDLKQ